MRRSTLAPAPRALTFTAAAALAAGVYACTDASMSPRAASSAPPAAARAGYDQPGVHRQYGAPVPVGHGRARTYVVLDEKDGGAPLEIGIALDEAALDGLPAPMPTSGADTHATDNEYLLPLPAQNPTPYQLVELDWNPAGHGPAGVYDVPHFDFHFYTVTRAERDAVDPAALGPAQYLAKSGNLPPAAERPAFYAPPGPPGAPVSAVPHMGVHWSDVRSPQLQRIYGHPAGYRPFTTTFIYGSWDGRFTFEEPMVTRAFLLGRRDATAAAARDSVMAVPTPQAYRPAGYYPAAYRVAYDAQAKEYRVALAQLAYRE